MTWTVVVNPAAGRRDEIVQRTDGALVDLGIPHDIFVPESPGAVADVVGEARESGVRRFASVGGDGTANLIVNALMTQPWDEPPTLAILPAGSGSDFIRTFALPDTIEKAARHLVTDDVYRCDLGYLEGAFGRRYFLNVADIGVAAASVTVAERLPRRMGGLRYGVGFWLALPRFRAAEIELTVGRRSFEGPAINVVAANGQFFGGGMNIAPRAMLVDGELDIQVFTGPRRQAFTVMPRVMRGLHLSHPGVRRFSGPSFELSCPDRWPVEMDGELIGAGPVTGGVVPGAIDFKI